MPTGPGDEVAAFLAAYPEAALGLREIVRAALPNAREMLDLPDRVVGYGFGDGYADLICTIIPSKTGVKLGVTRGAELADPDGLLEGAGKRHRYVAIAPGATVDAAAITRLLHAAVDAWSLRRRP